MRLISIKHYLSNCRWTESAWINFINKINKELELNINKLLIYGLFYKSSYMRSNNKKTNINKKWD
jgi:hypothetical protein